jgi:hypothetical protein
VSNKLATRAPDKLTLSAKAVLLVGSKPGTIVLGAIGLVSGIVGIVVVGAWLSWVCGILLAFVAGVAIRHRVTHNTEEIGAAADRFINELHARTFPNGSTLDKNYRISLFVPTQTSNGLYLHCVARTVSDVASAAPWRVTDDKEERAVSGLVNWCFTEQMAKDVPGLSDTQRSNPQLTTQYLQESCLDAAGHQERSWPFATLMVRFARRHDGNISCVIVVERRDGKKIEPTNDSWNEERSTTAVHPICAWDVELAAALWKALKGNSS